MDKGVLGQFSPAAIRSVSMSVQMQRDSKSGGVSGLFRSNPEPAEISWEKLAAKAQYRPAALAVFCNVSLRTLQRHFQRTYRTTLSLWLNALRLTKAYERIRSG